MYDEAEDKGTEPMADAAEVAGQQDKPTAEQPAAQPVQRGMFADPVVRGLAFVAVALVVLFLATVVGVLTSGMLAPTGPRTLAEKELATARAAVSAGTTETADWGTYIAALVDAGQYGRARTVLADARESLVDSGTAEFSIAEARLLRAEGKYEAAIEAADRAMQQIQTAYDEAIGAGGRAGQIAKIEGLHENYFIAALIKAEAYVSLEDWESVIAQYDIYIGRYRGAADILVLRGDAKANAGDVAGAEADYREALRFVPDSPEALKGLERIGASE